MGPPLAPIEGAGAPETAVDPPDRKTQRVGLGSATKIPLVVDHTAIDSCGVAAPYTPQSTAEEPVMPIVKAKPSATAKSATEDMIALRAQIEQRLLANPDYKAFIALTKAIAEALGDEVSDGAAGQKIIKPAAAGSVEISDFTQPDAVFALLTNVLHAPAQTVTLVKALSAHGITVGGANPNINLSSVLSKDGRFRSVRYNGRTCWWVKGTPFPGEIEAA
jgi:hypothetical protein